jgi:hypothetical protein
MFSLDTAFKKANGFLESNESDDRNLGQPRFHVKRS